MVDYSVISVTFNFAYILVSLKFLNHYYYFYRVVISVFRCSVSRICAITSLVNGFVLLLGNYNL